MACLFSSSMFWLVVKIHLIVADFTVSSGFYACIVRDVDDLNRLLESIKWTSRDNKLSAVFSKSFLIDSQINLFNSTVNDSSIFQLEIGNIQGFMLRMSPFLLINPVNPYSILVLKSGNLNFYDDQRRLVGSSCDDYLKAFYGLNNDEYAQRNKTELLKNYVGVFSLTLVELLIDQDTQMKGPICPLVFKSATIRKFDVSLVQKNLLFDHLFKFSNLSDIEGGDRGFDLDCVVYQFTLNQIYRVDLDDSVVNKNIFWRINLMSLHGHILSIEPRFFYNFAYLEKIYLSLMHLRTFFHSSDNKWFAAVNYANNFDPRLWIYGNESIRHKMLHLSVEIFLEDLSEEYDFPEEDFCLFKHFHHHQLVLMMVYRYLHFEKSSVKAQDLSCTVLYLIQYSFSTVNQSLLYTFKYNYLPKKQVVPDLEEERMPVQRCHFARKLELCKNSTVSIGGSVQPPSIYDIIYGTQWVEFVGPIVTFPVVSSVGFICNLLIALVIRDKANHKEHFKSDRLYQLMFMNSVFNMIECLNSVLLLLNECLGADSIFCSSVMRLVPVQYFKIVVVEYLGECMKTCSILTVLAISYERYHQTLGEKSFLNAMTNTRFMLVVFVFSLCSSVCKIFEYVSAGPETDGTPKLKNEYPRLTILSMRDQIWFEIIFAFHYLVNDFLLLTLNFIIDVRLLLIVRKDLKLKRQNLLNMSSSTTEKKLEKINEAEKNTNKMVIYSFIVYLFCRFPELIVYLHFLFIQDNSMYTYDYFTRCVSSLCLLLINIIQYLYMLSYITNLFFYFKFNRPFRDGFRDFFKMKR